MPRPIVVIPARMAAQRLPGKPLADIGGLPMIVRALRQAEAAGIGPVAVAAGDSEIVEAVRAHGGQAVLTDPSLPSGSDRIRAALPELDPEGRHDLVINLQGDMPLVEPDTIRALVRLFEDHPGLGMGTLVAPEASPADRTNADVVKAVLALARDARQGRALYFTRSTLYGEGPIWRHIGLYGYRPEVLEGFTAAPPSALERREKLEQLRAMELGVEIWAAVVDEAPISVDNPDDLEAARAAAR
ncbi:3-deoxy-manno-octulosonate cytidylyltransferase [Brevundimonas sp.]|uniref:3-deoxy-manno-octulosonate cytidylyltransferase n=1 Tax=Brevundimonas sp. TaxID=1871086 RepID=UPI0025D8ABC6|nr:3-deoxy-manno-octulosonate cytidylyltransferase [Brevundimonas sp.]